MAIKNNNMSKIPKLPTSPTQLKTWTHALKLCADASGHGAGPLFPPDLHPPGTLVATDRTAMSRALMILSEATNESEAHVDVIVHQAHLDTSPCQLVLDLMEWVRQHGADSDMLAEAEVAATRVQPDGNRLVRIEALRIAFRNVQTKFDCQT